MTAPAKLPPAPPDPKEQAVIDEAKSTEERALAFGALDVVRQQRILMRAAALVGELSWGRMISPHARAAIAHYCLELGADPMRHVDVLGGSIYLNADFYQELVASDPNFDYADEFPLHDDKRANDEEKQRRKDARVRWAVPEEAKGAWLVELHFKNRSQPLRGVNWAGRGRVVKDKKTGFDKHADPIGEADPEKTALTRAWRKAALKAAPAWLKRHPRLYAAEEILVQGDENQRLVGTDEPSVQRIEGTALVARADEAPHVLVETDDPKVEAVAGGGQQLNVEL